MSFGCRLTKFIARRYGNHRDDECCHSKELNARVVDWMEQVSEAPYGGKE
jgi:hypothetical protein